MSRGNKDAIELSEKHFRLRLAAAVIFLLFGAWMLAYGLYQLLGKSSGWQEISVSSDADTNCGGEFTLLYQLGASGIAASQESRLLTSCYTQACEDAYQLFCANEAADGVVNPYILNQNPNEVFTVEPELYQAFKLLEESESRILYLAPVYAIMQNVYSCDTDVEAKQLDPLYNEALAADVSDILSYANDSSFVQLLLLSDNRVCLYVSEEYLEFAKEDGIERFIDFYPVINAFVTDYLADELIENGYTLGILSSYDGYTRSLDGGEGSVSFSLYDRDGTVVYPAADVSMTGVSAIAALRDFPLAELDAYRYYVYGDGEIRTPYISAQDGLCHSAVSSLTGVSGAGSCASLVLSLLPAYLEETELSFSGDSGVIYCSGQTIYFSFDSAEFTNLYSKGTVSYCVEAIE